jgi:hypothetical protein
MESERDSADDLATARASLAICEYRGCSGEMPDPQQAVLDARTAAQQGDPDAMVTLASTAPPSFTDSWLHTRDAWWPGVPVLYTTLPRKPLHSER